MTPEEAAQKQAAAIVERAQLIRKKFLAGLTPDEAKRSPNWTPTSTTSPPSSTPSSTPASTPNSSA